MPHAIRRIDLAGRYVAKSAGVARTVVSRRCAVADSNRDVTDNLQLLLRKSGHHLHTSAEKEVVRTIKEKTCYLALNPVKEEKDNGGAWEEFRLPDGKVIQVRYISLPFLCLWVLEQRAERLECTGS